MASDREENRDVDASPELTPAVAVLLAEAARRCFGETAVTRVKVGADQAIPTLDELELRIFADGSAVGLTCEMDQLALADAKRQAVLRYCGELQPVVEAECAAGRMPTEAAEELLFLIEEEIPHAPESILIFARGDGETAKGDAASALDTLPLEQLSESIALRPIASGAANRRSASAKAQFVGVADAIALAGNACKALEGSLKAPDEILDATYIAFIDCIDLVLAPSVLKAIGRWEENLTASQLGRLFDSLGVTFAMRDWAIAVAIRDRLEAQATLTADQCVAARADRDGIAPVLLKIVPECRGYAAENSLVTPALGAEVSEKPE